MTRNAIDDAVAQMVADINYDRLDEAALAGCRRLIQDQLGLQVGCSTLPWCGTVLDFTRASHSPGRSSVVASADTFSAADAAFVNATFGHSFEFDDAHAASLSHPGSAVVAAAIAVGEEMGADLRTVIEGIVAGYEAYTRIGTLASPHLLHGGFHPHAVLAPFGTAAVVAKMRGFDVETTRNALAIAFSHSSGATEYSSSGGSIKRVHSGIGARNGIRSAEMAAAGITGPAAYLSGAKGFYQTFVKIDLVERDVDRFSLDRSYEIARPLFKPYCACGYNHTFIDGARTFAERADEIVDIALTIPPGGDIIVGNRNRDAWAPNSIEQLQYALPFQFALSVLGVGNGYSVHKSYLDGRLDISPGSDIATMAGRVSITPDPRLEEEYRGKLVGDITVTFDDGTTEHVFIEDSIGSADKPMSEADLDVKFLDLTDEVLGADRSRELLGAVKNAPLTTPVSELIALTRA